MKKKRMFYTMIISLLLSLFVIPSSFSIFKAGQSGSGNAELAVWNVTLEQNGVNNSLSLIPGFTTADYTLNVKSLSDVDVNYDVVVSNLPSGISVVIDSNVLPTVSGSTATFTNVGTITYNAVTKVNTHTLTFSGANNATPVNNQNVSINVIVNQILPN